MLHAIFTIAAEAAEHGGEVSKLPFYVAGTLLALWALAVSAVGLSRHGDWPAGRTGRGIMGVSALLVLGAMVTSVLTG